MQSQRQRLSDRACKGWAFALRMAAVCVIGWLVFMTSPAFAQLQTNAAFVPANNAWGNNSTLQIELLNNTASAATGVAISASLPTSPTGLAVGSGAILSNSCGGTASATTGGTSITLSGGTVAASVAGTPGRCLIEVSVRATPASPPTSYVFTLPGASVSSSIGAATNTSSATLNIFPVNPITGAATVSVANIHGLGSAVRLRLQLNNSNAYMLTGVGFTNTLPTQLQFAPSPAATSTCGGTLTVPANGTTWSLSGGTIATGSNCVIEADFVARNSTTIPADGNATISIAANSVTSDQSARNTAAISRSIRVQKGAAVTAVFNPAAITAGQTATHTITLINYNAAAISGFSFSDAMPTGVTITGGVSTTCGGTPSFTATTISLTGATLAAAPSGIADTRCTITMTVTAPANGNYSNSIPAGAIGGISYNAASATLLVSSVSAAKAFSPTTAPLTGVSALTITLTNRTVGTAATITSLTDNLTTMGTGFTVASSVTPSTTCGGSLSAPAGGTSIVLTGGAIPAASSATSPGTCTVTVGVQVGTTAATGNRTNSIAVNGLRTSLGNNLVSATARLTVAAPITVSTTFATANVPKSSVVRVSVTITRAAYAALMTNVSFTDPLPSGFVIAPTPSLSSTCSGGTVSAAPGTTSLSMTGASLGTVISSSSSCTVSVNVMAPATLGTYVNTIAVGNVTANTSVGAVSNLTAASATVTVVDGISISSSFSPISVVPGQVSRLTLTISNPASLATALSGISLTDNLPSGLIIAPVPAATRTAVTGTCGGTINATAGGSSFSWVAGTMSAGAVCELAVDVTPTAVGALTNVVPVGAMTSAQGRSNQNSTSATLVSSGNADVAVTKSDAVATMIAGSTTTYTITIVNNSSVLAVAGLPVLDPQPDDMSFTAWTCTASSGSSCADAAGTGALDTAVTLAPLGTATYSVTARVDPASELTSVTNTVTIDPSSTGVFDPVSANNSASDTNSITISADVGITKTVNIPNPVVGEQAAFTITVSNAGPSLARDVVATDTILAGYVIDDAVVSTGSFAEPDWTIGDLAPGASATLTLTVTVNATGPYDNSASVTASTPDPVMGNNIATVTPTTVALYVEKQSLLISDPVNGTSSPRRLPGAIIEYRITIRNEGTAMIGTDSIVIDDVLPADLAARVSAMGGAVTMIDGSPPSGLAATSLVIEWTNRAGGVGPYDYTPSPDINGFDSAVTGIRIRPSGSMAAGTPSAPASAQFVFRARIQ